MVQYVTTPWRHRRDLLLVRDQLYPPSTTSHRRQAVARVAIWVQRGNCPHLVESTALLTAALLNDVPGNSSFCIRAAYATSFSRFVTGLLDSHQTTRRKVSMYALAKTLGLPATYVELRHQATHEELPSVQRLRGAARKALGWIWEHYWADLTLDTEEEEDTVEELRRIVAEEDGDVRREMEERLGRWEGDRIVGGLLEMELEEGDREGLLRSVRLSRRVMAEDGEPATLEEIKSIEEVKGELARLRESFDDSRHEDASGVDTRSIPIIHDHSAEKGWALWDGAWTPKPIGTLC